jgi:hypothetical protein
MPDDDYATLSLVSVGFDKMCKPGFNPAKTHLEKSCAKTVSHRFNEF